MKTPVSISFLIKLQASGLQACNFIKKETPVPVFSCEYCEIFKNTYFEEHLGTAPSVVSRDYYQTKYPPTDLIHILNELQYNRPLTVK